MDNLFIDFLRVSIPYRYATNTAAGSFDLFAAVFQFLIGTLQTHVFVQQGYDPHSVSIPYRYATNEALARIVKHRGLVSIPYRYATNGI